jgi:hypothetical protein
MTEQAQEIMKACRAAREAGVGLGTRGITNLVGAIEALARERDDLKERLAISDDLNDFLLDIMCPRGEDGCES